MMFSISFAFFTAPALELSFIYLNAVKWWATFQLMNESALESTSIYSSLGLFTKHRFLLQTHGFYMALIDGWSHLD